VPGGLLITVAGWRAIFFINLPLGAVGCWLTVRYAAETPRARGRGVDLPGQAAVMLALAALAGATIWAGSRGFGAPAVLGGYGLAVLALAVFVVLEARQTRPMVPLSMFRTPAFSVSVAAGFIINIVFYGLIFVFSLYFQRINGLSPLSTGLAFLPMMGAVLPVNLVAARVSERIGAPATIAAGAVLSALGCLALLGIGPGTSYRAIGAQLTIIGAGLGLLVPPLTSTLLGSVEKSRSGIAAGVLNATRQTGSVLGVALFGSLVGRSDAFMAGAHAALIISASLLLLAAAAIWRGTAKRASP